MIRLGEAAKQIRARVEGDPQTELWGLSEDSRHIKPGWLFAAVPGYNLDGRDFIGQALEQGAAAILSLDDGDDRLKQAQGRPLILVEAERLRPAMAKAAEFIFGSPADKMSLVGLTGTNGKTTTSYLVEAMLTEAQVAPGVLGTVNFRWPGHQQPSINTTPEGPKLFELLAAMRTAGSRAAVLEVSSHALALGRLGDLCFDAALFSNLSRDHLDFHHDFEDYYQAKKLLFTRHLKAGPRRAVINIDDAYGRRLTGELNRDQVLSYGFSPEAEVRGSQLESSRQGLSLRVDFASLSLHLSSPLLAELNAYNILSAAALGFALGLEPHIIQKSLAQSTGAPGRLEKVGPAERLAVVDYAHCPDALAKALSACRGLEPKRLLLLFGCGGDRDRGKRPLMGRLAGELADLSIITSDNPRTEEPGAILMEVEAGLADLPVLRAKAGELSSDSWQSGTYILMLDRRAAIEEAVRLMAPGDILLIAGKGHEDYQIIGREKRPFDDRLIVAQAMRKAGWLW